MSGSRPDPVEEPHLAEQHLGDRLSALVDGELGHETRERVLAHLATCARCKAEADAQRALKNVFAEAAPPPPSASFLARLQGLPGGGQDGGAVPGGGPFAAGPGTGSTGAFGARRGDHLPFGYAPHRAPGWPPLAEDRAAPVDRGFRVHPVGRSDDGRPSSRGLRFAFAAAGAVSLAAVALGGVTTAVPGGPAAEARGGAGTGSNVTPARSADTAAGPGAVTPDSRRRRPVGPLLARAGALTAPVPGVPTSLSAPLLPGPPPGAARARAGAAGGLTAPVLAGVAAVSPLIRPLERTMSVPDLPLPDRSALPGATGSGLLSAADAVLPDTTPAPSVFPIAPRPSS
ncbi:zf-HC2 domain-containing protein [Streptomyces sp. NPDC100445]|uniref:zf-HC2 domain-containing protein n=1 Tax=Streptomyces sp. NPDC100445 TaxID=3366102 RepID=UPI0038267AEC